MKRTLILTLVLVLLAAAGLWTASAYVNLEKENVILTETVLSGDVAKAKGVKVELHAALRQQTFWDTTYTVGEKDPAVTGFRFSPSQVPYSWRPDYRGVSPQINLEQDMEAWDRSSDEAPTGLALAYQALAEKAPVEQEVSETVRLRDYCEFYPLDIDVDLPGVALNWWHFRQNGLTDVEYTDRKAMEDLHNFFKIPVGEQDTISIHLTKNADGRIHSWGTASDSKESLYLWPVSVVGDDACYFTFQWNDDYEGEPDLSQIPGGYGVYRLPYGPKMDRGVALKMNEVYTDDLAMVYPLDPADTIQALKLSPDQQRLLLFFQRENTNYLTVVDLQTYEAIQTLELAQFPDQGHDFALLDLPGGFVQLCPPYRLTVAEELSDGTYAIAMSASLKDMDPFRYIYWENAASDWDGQRLALAWHDGNGYQNSFFLALFENNDRSYIGHYQSSLDFPSSEIRPWENEWLSVRLP